MATLTSLGSIAAIARGAVTALQALLPDTGREEDEDGNNDNKGGGRRDGGLVAGVEGSAREGFSIGISS